VALRAPLVQTRWKLRPGGAPASGRRLPPGPPRSAAVGSKCVGRPGRREALRSWLALQRLGTHRRLGASAGFHSEGIQRRATTAPLTRTKAAQRRVSDSMPGLDDLPRVNARMADMASERSKRILRRVFRLESKCRNPKRRAPPSRRGIVSIHFHALDCMTAQSVSKRERAMFGTWGNGAVSRS
jgi:hypothetical protein